MYSQEFHPHLTNPVDRLLADVAIRIQLSQTNYNRAVSRYKSVSDWIDRDESPLKDRVDIFYPQGSMAIGATIASRLNTDEFDIDLVAQLSLDKDVSPKIALDVLYDSIKGSPGSRYYQMTERRTRCITVDYADNMHLDVTPAVRRVWTPERESWIFHQRPETPGDPGFRPIANPYGFAEWFKNETPADQSFANVFEARAADHEMQVLRKSADTEPVEPQQPPFRKSRSVVALQLLKRWRNVQYDVRSGRRPPSVVMAKLAADASGRGESILGELRNQARYMLSVFRSDHDRGRIVEIVNPKCIDDVLTDRWPESLTSQEVFVHDLNGLVTVLDRLSAGCPLDEMKTIMMGLFGEVPTESVFGDYVRQFGRDISSGRSSHRTDTGGLVIPSTGVGLGVTRPSGNRSTPRHTFYGD